MNRGPNGTLRALVASVPDLPRAACVGTDPELWSSDTYATESPRTRDERTDRAVAVCRACPEFAPCHEWVASSRHYELNGVVAGGMVIPSITAVANRRQRERTES